MWSFGRHTLRPLAPHLCLAYLWNYEGLSPIPFRLVRCGSQIATTQLSLTLMVTNGRAAMFRIGVHDEGEATSLTIEGKLTTRSAMELEKCWQEVIAARPLRPIVVKLAEVTLIDFECRKLLTRMCRQGVRLVPTGFLMNAIVEQIEAEVAKERPSA